MTTAITNQEKMAEAKVRMEMLGVSEDIINAFMNYEMIPFFITGTEEASLYVTVTNHELTHRIEEMFNVVVYAIIVTTTPYGVLESLLYVSCDEHEWEMDRECIQDGYAMTWTENLTYPTCSEFGSIAVSASEKGTLNREG